MSNSTHSKRKQFSALTVVALLSIAVAPGAQESIPEPIFVPRQALPEAQMPVPDKSLIVEERSDLPVQTTSALAQRPELADVARFRQWQTKIAQAQQALREKHQRTPGLLDTYSRKEQPQFAHHCVKLISDDEGKPAFDNQCGKPVLIAYCWVGWHGDGGALDCQRGGYGMSEGGSIAGASAHNEGYGLLHFACTKPGIPSAIRTNSQPIQLLGQCYWEAMK